MQQAELRAGEDSDEDAVDVDDEPAPRKRQKQKHEGGNEGVIRSRIKSEVLDLGSPSDDDE